MKNSNEWQKYGKKMYYLPSKIFKIGPGITKIQAKRLIWKETTWNYIHVIKWKKLGNKAIFGLTWVLFGGNWRKLAKNWIMWVSPQEMSRKSSTELEFRAVFPVVYLMNFLLRWNWFFLNSIWSNAFGWAVASRKRHGKFYLH